GGAANPTVRKIATSKGWRGANLIFRNWPRIRLNPALPRKTPTKFSTSRFGAKKSWAMRRAVNKNDLGLRSSKIVRVVLRYVFGVSRNAIRASKFAHTQNSAESLRNRFL